jgi:energy-coupling factor transport system permease protein
MLSSLGPPVKHQRDLVLIIPRLPHIIDGMVHGAKPIPIIDARVSLVVFFAIGVAALFVMTTARAMVGVLVYLAVLYAVVSAMSRGGPQGMGGMGMGMRAFRRHLARLGPAVVLIVLLNGLLVPGEAIVSIGGKTVLTREGTAAGIFFSLRLLVLYAAMLLFLAVTPPVEFARGIYAIVRPFSPRAANRAAFYGFLVLSFVPLFSDEMERIKQAQSFRGADLGSGGIAGRAAAARSLVVPLILSAIHRSGQLAAVIELRGLRDRVGRALPAVRPGVVDAVLVSTTAVVLVAISFWSERGGG